LKTISGKIYKPIDSISRISEHAVDLTVHERNKRLRELEKICENLEVNSPEWDENLRLRAELLGLSH